MAYPLIVDDPDTHRDQDTCQYGIGNMPHHGTKTQQNNNEKNPGDDPGNSGLASSSNINYRTHRCARTWKTTNWES